MFSGLVVGQLGMGWAYVATVAAWTSRSYRRLSAVSEPAEPAPALA